jgi:hypothetical protein
MAAQVVASRAVLSSTELVSQLVSSSVNKTVRRPHIICIVKRSDHSKQYMGQDAQIGDVRY